MAKRSHRYALFVKLLRLGRRYWGGYIGICLLGLVVAAANAAVAQVLRMIVDAAVAGSRSKLRDALTLGIAVVLVGSVSGFAMSVLTAVINIRSIRALQVRIFEHMMRARLDQLARFHTGDAMNRIRDSASLAQSAVNQQAIQMFQSVMQVLLVLGYLAVVNVPLTVGTLAISLLIPLASGPLSRKLGVLYTSRQQAQSVEQGLVLESVQALETVQGASLGNSLVSKLSSLASLWLRLNSETVKWEAMLSRINYLGILVGFFFVLGYGGYLVIQGHLDVGAVAAFLIAFQQVFNPLSQLGALWPQFQQSLSQGERVFELLELPLEREDRPAPSGDRRESPTITLSQVSFSYRQGEAGLLSASGTFRPASITVVLGGSGAGKTTLMRLLLGFYTPVGGRICVDQEPLDTLDLGRWRGRIGYVAQDPGLLTGTIYENLRGAQTEVTREQAHRALWAASADEFVTRLPEGLDTDVLFLSGGERQRLAIARAVIRNAPVYLFDEPTSALDIETEGQLWGRLGDWLRERTTIIITHRHAVLDIADQVMALVEGSLVAMDRNDPKLDPYLVRDRGN